MVTVITINVTMDTWLRSIMKVDMATEMVSLVCILVKIWSTIPIVAASAGT